MIKKNNMCALILWYHFIKRLLVSLNILNHGIRAKNYDLNFDVSIRVNIK